MIVIRYLLCLLLLLFKFTAFGGVPIVRNTENGVELQNDLVSIVLSNKAELVSCTVLESGADIASHSKSRIARIKLSSGTILEASCIVLVGDVMTVMIGQYKVEMRIRAFNDFFTAEVLNQSLPGVDELVFLDLKFKYDSKIEDAYVAAGVAMSLQTDPVYYPTGDDKTIKGRCTAQTGFKGAKLALLVSKKTELRSYMQRVYDTIPSGDVPFTKAGGCFALDNDINTDDCVIISGGNKIGDIKELIRFYSSLGIKQFDFHEGPKTFMTGQFSFPVYGSATAFKQLVTDPLREAGILSILHTYSYYIDYEAHELLSNPKWQQQLEFREVFTLSNTLSESAKQITVKEDASVLNKDASYWSVRSPYLLVDEEIIKYTLNENGFSTCQRGMCGTKAEKHSSGTKVRIISGKYYCIAPQIGSELYYEIAHRTARAYNEGGFGGIYFDAYDGLGTHLKKEGLDEYLWYYGASFINEVLKYCEGTPIIEYSSQHPTVWAARGRCGAWDYPVRGYKNFIDDHMNSNKNHMARFFVTTLGWYNFYPLNKNQPMNYATKYMFFDDVDYLGTKAIAYNQTMVYNGLKESDVESIPAMRRNLELYSQYNRLRKEKYFSDTVLETLKKGDYEYRLARKNGKWGFSEAVYDRSKIRDIRVDGLSGHNPFKRQKPFIRLENMYSSKGDGSILLLQFDKTKDFKGQVCEKVFTTPVNMSQNLGLKISIKGNGVDSKDAICIRLTPVSTGLGTGVADYVVCLNLKGWQDIVLTNLDNAEFSNLKFKGMDDPLYQVHRYSIDYSKISSVKLYLAGECNSVRIGSIEAVPLVENALTNPIVRISSANVTFKDTIHSGEYVEYWAGSRTAMVYDSIGNSRKIRVSRKGRLRVPNGDYTASVSGETALDGAPAEVTLTMGVYGAFIHN